MKYTPFKTLHIASGLTLIVLVSMVCAFLLWYQRILPPKFKLGTRSPIKLVTNDERTVLDLEATETEKLKAKRKAISHFLENPPLERNDLANDASLNQLLSLIDKLDSFFAFRTQKLNSHIISNDSKALLLVLTDDELTDFWKTISQATPNNNRLSGPFYELKRNIWSIEELKVEMQDLRLAWKQAGNEYSRELKEVILRANKPIISQAEWKQIKSSLLPSAKIILQFGFLGTIEPNSIKAILSQQYPGQKLTDEQLKFIKTVYESSMKANLKIHLDDLNQIEEKAMSEVEPTWRTLPAKTTVLEPGQLITKNKYAIIEQLNMNRREPNRTVFQDAFWMTLLVTFSFWLYVKLEKFQLSLRQVFLLSFLMILASAFVGLFAYEKPAALPLAAVAMITALFFKPAVGFSAGTLFGILCSQALGIDALTLVPSFVGVIVGTILSQKAKNRADLAQAGIWLGLAQVVAYMAVALISDSIPFTTGELIIQGVSGLITALIVSSGMPYLESLFSVITRFRLLELSDPNQPLLQKLHDEAPGTYEHTLVVADLAQDAAKKIEADYELVRVGILYHDVGKLYNPQIFIENQFGGHNPHETMSPIESAKAIIAHVPEGIEMARKNRLPEPICVFIPAHQGTSRAGHFFLKACQENPGLKDDMPYRYPGPKPSSRETGVAMLADTVEATIRSLKTDDKELVKETINNLIDSRVKDNQLSDSGLTKYDLERIARSFYESWKNKNHERVRYISDLKKC
jgi:cyclic-di-AMP phosphodiesterase PgpH